MSHTLSSYRSNSPLTVMTVIMKMGNATQIVRIRKNRNEETAANHEAEAPPLLRRSTRVRSKLYRFGQSAYD